ncbi:MAG: GNAT family N-acetyltransferase [Christensenellales bacterium]|jgi:GNAT superfamily N-acetyltransferase
MNLEIKEFTKQRLDDVIQFERNLRDEEKVWGWEIDKAYIERVEASFDNPSFDDSISLLAYIEEKVVGRIDSAMIKSRFDGSVKAYLDWICVIKSYRHNGVAQALLNALLLRLKERNIDTLIALTAGNEESQSFYSGIPNSIMRDIGIWIDV